MNILLLQRIVTSWLFNLSGYRQVNMYFSRSSSNQYRMGIHIFYEDK